MSTAFNGTTVLIATVAVAQVKSISYRGSCAKVPITGADAATRLYHPGLPSEVLTITKVGSDSHVKGTTPAIVVTWTDAGTDGSMTKGRLMKTPGMSGSLDGPNHSTLIYKKSK